MAASSANPFLERILARMEGEPDRVFAEVCVGAERTFLTWGDLGRRAHAFASAYRGSGVLPGDVLFLILRHGADLYPAYLGGMLAGAVPSFLPFPSEKQDSDLYWRDHLSVFERTRARLLVTYAELAAAVRKRAPDSIPIVDIADVNETRRAPPSASRGDDDIALLQHSSGTTGLKKGTALSYRAIRQQLDTYAGRLGVGGDSVIASWLPLYHDMGLIACFMLPAYLGAKLVSLDAFEWTVNPSMLLEAIERAAATHVWLPNFAIAHLTRATPKRRRFRLDSLVAVIGCSEPNKAAVFEAFIDRFAADGMTPTRMGACYAMAETVFAVSQSEPGMPPRRLGARVRGRKVETFDREASLQVYVSNGRPLDGVEVKTVDGGRFLEVGEAGELCVRAPFVFKEYFNDHATTRGAFVEGFFRTGDLGFVHDGEIYVFGRVKEIIIVNGRNFFANDLESVVNEVAGVKRGRCVAFGLYMQHFGAEQIVIVAETDDAVRENVAVAAISAALNAHFGVAPGDVRVVAAGWLVKTTSGKLSRAENIRKYTTAFVQAHANEAAPEALT